MKGIVRFGWFAAGLAVLLLAACSKYLDNAAPMQGGVMVIQASPDAPTVALSINDHPVDTALAFPENTGYTTVPAGNTQLKLVNMHRITDTIVTDTTVDTVIIDSVRTLVNESIAVEANKAYSVFVYDSVSHIRTMKLADNLTVRGTGNAAIRFLHLAPGAPALDVFAGETPLFSGRSFADNVSDAAKAAFDSLAAGTYTLQIKTSGNDSIVASLPGITVKPGAVYTLFAAGSTADTLRARLIVNYEPAE